MDISCLIGASSDAAVVVHDQGPVAVGRVSEAVAVPVAPVAAVVVAVAVAPVVHHGLVHLVAVVDRHGAGRGHSPAEESRPRAQAKSPLAAAAEEAA